MVRKLAGSKESVNGMSFAPKGSSGGAEMSATASSGGVVIVG